MRGTGGGVSSRSVGTFAGYRVPYSTTRIFNVPLAARNQMDVAVMDCLACRLPVVHSDVEAGDSDIAVFDVGLR